MDQATWKLDPSRPVHFAVVMYGLAIVSVAASTGLTFVFQSFGAPTALFFPSLLLVSWYGGAGPGLLCALLSAMAIDFFFIEPKFEVSLHRNLTHVGAFLLSAVIVSLWSLSRRRAAATLQRAHDELQAKSQELEAFAYSVSHDLRAPLRHAMGYTELLRKRASSTLDETSLRYMATVTESAKRMGTLIDDLLAFSRIGRAAMTMAPVSLDQLVKEAIAELRQETQGRDLVWKIGPLPTVNGDRSMLKLALVNLLSNAIKFTRPRRPAEIELGSTNGPQGEAVVFVRDNGVGFDMTYVEKLFGVFQRLHRAEDFEGTGIGLANVQRVAERHGGRVWAEGVVDKGATFYFSIPLATSAGSRT